MSNTLKLEITLYNDNGREYTIIFREPYVKFEVCGRCEGHGSHLNPNIGEHAYTSEEFAEDFPDEDYDGYNPREEYFKRGGIYDVKCSECHGNRVVPVLNEEAFDTTAKKKLLERIHAKWKADAEYESERRYQERMGY